MWPPSGGSFGVRQLAAAFLQASLLAARIPEPEVAEREPAASESGSKLPLFPLCGTSLMHAMLFQLDIAASKLAASESGSKLPHSKAGSARNPSKDEGAAFTHAAK